MFLASLAFHKIDNAHVRLLTSGSSVKDEILHFGLPGSYFIFLPSSVALYPLQHRPLCYFCIIIIKIA